MDNQSLFIVFLVVFIWLLGLSYLLWRNITHYRRLIGKSKKEDLKEILESLLNKVEGAEQSLSEVSDRLRLIEGDLPKSIKKVGLVRFNPYRELGSNQSFSLALLDEGLNGIVISALHSRDTTRVYAKPILDGKEAKHSLSEEEQEAVKIAKSLRGQK